MCPAFALTANSIIAWLGLNECLVKWTLSTWTVAESPPLSDSMATRDRASVPRAPLAKASSWNVSMYGDTNNYYTLKQILTAFC